MAGATDRIAGLVELTRPINAVAAGVLTAIGAYVAAGLIDAPAAVGAAVGATVLATGAGNAINDYFDREIDAHNAPDRPIPRGAVSPRGALAFSAVLFIGAVVLALSLPIAAVAIAGINLVALVTYTTVFKGTPGAGNALIAYLGGSTFLFGGAAVGRIEPTIVLFVLAGGATFTREIVKDVEDIAGDEVEGLTTLPIAIGERPALWVATAAILLAVAASPIPYVLGLFGSGYLLLVAPAALLMLYATWESFRDPTAAQGHLKYGMFLAAAAFLVGRALG